MKTLILSAVWLCTCPIAFAQLPYGEISQEEYNLKTYAKDPDAPAVVLQDIGLSYFQENSQGLFEVVFEQRTRIKILSEGGLKYGEVSIPYYMERKRGERVIDIEGTTFNQENGQPRQSELNASEVFTENINGYLRVRKFAMPNV
ncbi:MAG: hypothetical protein AAFV07_16990, partial [Bacteroidota bacterium]